MLVDRQRSSRTGAGVLVLICLAFLKYFNALQETEIAGEVMVMGISVTNNRAVAIEPQTTKENEPKKSPLTKQPPGDADMENDAEESDADSAYISKTGKISPKPYWRGRIHRIAFYLTIILFVAFITFTKHINKGFLVLYFMSQLLLYGISSTYHMTEWKSAAAEGFFRKLDHSSIFFMISGTQTCMFMSARKVLGLPAKGTPVFIFIPVTYAFTAVGVAKVFLFCTMPRYVNVLYYIIHGCVATPFFSLKAFSKDKYIALASLMGGITYIIGGAIYGTRRPNPWPKTFGYHEIFHLLTVIANLCFMSTLLRGASAKHLNSK